YPLGFGWGFTLSAVLHLMLSFFFLRKLLLRYKASEAGAFLACVTYNFGAPQLATLYAGDPGVFYVACWLPALFYFGSLWGEERRGSLFLSVVIALVILGGHPQVLLFGLAASFLFSFRV